MPLSIVENDSFRHLLSVLDNKYQPVSRGTVSSRMVQKQREFIKNQLEQKSWVFTTVDIWSDRKMRGYLGVTAHAIEVEKPNINLKSYLLSCNRFTGSHTGEKISTAFEAICDEYAIKNKIDYILSDNASNMKRAFTVCFPGNDTDDDGPEDSDDGDNDDLDDGSLWEELDEDVQQDIDLALTRNCQKQHLQCFYTHASTGGV
ncbi:zinc finger BED domain-containing 4-like [Paramuricea clavata]|uniref:Zinc finger BED domain-containing 4-like n=1 Tax=Paramuricea clavata TaxID=317549 RepID=A0A6S7GC95_PARCT|nr:zinc finger BED domain-containing 4-like [Paramuricea clavata]